MENEDSQEYKDFLKMHEKEKAYEEDQYDWALKHSPAERARYERLASGISDKDIEYHSKKWGNRLIVFIIVFIIVLIILLIYDR